MSDPIIVVFGMGKCVMGNVTFVKSMLNNPQQIEVHTKHNKTLFWKYIKNKQNTTPYRSKEKTTNTTQHGGH
jgi:hypothetical protein